MYIHLRNGIVFYATEIEQVAGHVMITTSADRCYIVAVDDVTVIRGRG